MATTAFTTETVSRELVIHNAASVFRTVTRGKLPVYKPSLYDISKAIEAKDL
jgi:hypothetical protein